MAVKNKADNTPLPGSVFNPRQVRILKVVVITMGIMLIGGFALVIAVIAYQAIHLGEDKESGLDKNSGPDKPLAAVSTVLPGDASELAIPAGATVVSMALDGDALALHLTSSAGAEIVVIDLTTGKVISRIKLNANKP